MHPKKTPLVCISKDNQAKIRNALYRQKFGGSVVPPSQRDHVPPATGATTAVTMCCNLVAGVRHRDFLGPTARFAAKGGPRGAPMLQPRAGERSRRAGTASGATVLQRGRGWRRDGALHASPLQCHPRELLHWDELAKDAYFYFILSSSAKDA